MHNPFTRPTSPALLGTRADGRPIYVMAGASPEGDPPAGGGQQTQEAQQTTQQQQPAQQTTQTQQPPQGEPVVEDDDDAAKLSAKYTPEVLAKLVLKYRTEAGDSRVQAKTQAAKEARDKVLEDLKPLLLEFGVIQPDDKVDPAKLSGDLSAVQSTAKTQAQELAVLRTQKLHGGDADKLLDSRSFMRSIGELDPTAEDFQDKVVAASKAAVAADASLKLVQATGGKSGGQFTGGPGDAKDERPMTPAQRMRNAYGG